MVKTIAWVLAISLIFGLGTAIAQKQDSTQSQQQQPLLICPC